MPDGKPNILVIWGDDIGISNLSCYSTGSWATPPQTSTASPRRGCSSPTPTASRAAPPAAPPSSPGRASPHRVEQGRHSGRRGRSARGGPHHRRAAQAARGMPRGSSARTTSGTATSSCPRCTASTSSSATSTTSTPRRSPSIRDWPPPRIPRVQRDAPPARRHPLLGHRRRRRHRGRAVRPVGKQRIEDTGPLTKKRMETVDDERRAAQGLHRAPGRRRTRRSSSG